MIKLFTTLLVSFGVLWAAPSALEIMQKVEARDTGNNLVLDMKMILIDKNGSKRIRSMKSFRKEIGDTTKQMIFFTAPSDVNNTAFLTFDYSDETKDDDQWLYLPALKKVKRIPSSDKSGSFMGSDFSYSDMTDRDLEAYTFKLIKEVNFKGTPTWLIESTPKTQKTIDETGYSKSQLYVRKDNYIPIAAKHFVAGSKEYKLMQVHELKLIDNIWFSTKMSMTTKQGKQTLHKTLIQQDNISVDARMKESSFGVRSLEKGL
jgi:hypothetical protein